MVGTKKLTYKSAFTMIELIFAIVIVGISVLSLPMMMQINSKGIENNIIQEAIFATSARLNYVLSNQWDPNSLENAIVKVIPTSATDCSKDGGKQREGHVNRFCLNSGYNSSSPSIGTVGTYSLGGQRVSDNSLLEGGAINSSGYKNDYKIDVDVSFSDFGEINASDKNIKEIIVTAKNTNGDLVVLKSYSANIGEVEIKTRNFY